MRAAFPDPDIRLWTGGGVASRTDALVLPGRRLDWSSGDHASWAVVDEKAGFTREGRLRRSYRYGDGEKHDELRWARLAVDPAPPLG